MNTKKYDWILFYKEFADVLLTYKERRQDLITKVKSIFEIAEINLPTLETDNIIVDIDPFTIFGLFNKSSMKETNRNKIIIAVAEIFSLKSPLPSAFDSVPTLNNQNATFYGFINDREPNDIEDLWNLFESALNYAKKSTTSNCQVVSKYFDLVINKKNNGNSKVTMGLFWIAPESYLNLDQRNVWYIYESNKMPDSLIDSLPKIDSKNKIQATVYFEIVNKLQQFLQGDNSQFSNFVELSSEAWRYSNEVNELKRENTKQAQNNRVDGGEALADEDIKTVHYWLYSPGLNSVKWNEFYENGVMGIGWHLLGDLSLYDKKSDMRNAMKEQINSKSTNKNAAHAVWQFAKEMKPGDIVFVKKGLYQVLGRGIVESDYYYNEELDSDFPNLRKVNWTHKGEWQHPGQAAMKTLTDITQYTDYVEKLCNLFENDPLSTVDEEPEIRYPSYDVTKFLKEVFMSEDDYETLVSLVRAKKNVILQGAPGVGKTYVAKRLAYSMMGVKDQERVMMVQFHQNYSYEDLIEGYRPTDAGFEIKKGSLYTFCKKASEDLENEYFFIIDEINRGNLSKIFGELFMLIENDKRGNSLQLLYSGEKFYVSKNIYIIGMMNTADRSLAMLDYALRRRFAFFEMKPGFRSNGFIEYKNSKNNKLLNVLIEQVEKLNNEIENDESLGDGFSIGHSYFSNLEFIDSKVLSNIVEFELIPLIKEYWFDEPTKVKDWSSALRGAIK